MVYKHTCKHRQRFRVWNSVLRFAWKTQLNIGLQFLASGLSISWNPLDFMKSGMKSGGFHMKSTQNLIKANVSTKTIQFDECRRGAMNPGFHEILGHSPLPAPPKLKSFCWNIWFYKVLGGFHMKSTRFHVKSAGFKKYELLRVDQV